MTTLYDKMPFRSKLHRGRHPDRFRVIGSVLGRSSPQLEKSRILELGCGAAEGLVALALEFPDAALEGTDLSHRAILEGRRIASSCGVKNLSLSESDLRSFSPSAKEYQYIICHGLYSWVSDEVRQSILKIIEKHLSSDGIAFISFNANPGAKTRSILGDLASRFTPDVKDPAEKAKDIRSLFRMYEGAIGYEFERPYSLLMNRELAHIKQESDGSLLHDLLASDSKAFYLRDFAKDLSVFDLSFLGDSRMSRNVGVRTRRNVRGEASDMLLGLSALECGEMEDFLFHTTFREAIVCKGRVESNVLLPDKESIRDLWISASFEVSEDDVELVDIYGRTVEPSFPLLKSALLHLGGIWPDGATLDDLVSKLKVTKSDQEVLMTSLLGLFEDDLVELFKTKPKFSSILSDKPAASPLARYQAATDSKVTNLRFETVELSPFEKEVLLLIDGSKSISEIIRHFKERQASGVGAIKEDGVEVLDGSRVEELISELIGEALETLRKGALLQISP